MAANDSPLIKAIPIPLYVELHPWVLLLAGLGECWGRRSTTLPQPQRKWQYAQKTLEVWYEPVRIFWRKKGSNCGNAADFRSFWPFSFWPFVASFPLLLRFFFARISCYFGSWWLHVLSVWHLLLHFCCFFCHQLLGFQKLQKHIFVWQLLGIHLFKKPLKCFYNKFWTSIAHKKLKTPRFFALFEKIWGRNGQKHESFCHGFLSKCTGNKSIKA